MTFCVDNSNVCSICHHVWTFQCTPFESLALKGKGSRKLKIWNKIGQRPVFPTVMYLQKLTLLCPAVCSRSIIVHFVTDGRTDACMCEPRQIWRDIRCRRCFFFIAMHNKRIYDLKMKVKIREYTITMVPFDAKYQPLQKSYLSIHFFQQLSPFSRYSHLKLISWPWKCRSKLWCTAFTMTPFDGKYMTF